MQIYANFQNSSRTEWETTDDPIAFCHSVRQTPPFHKDKAILNVIDTAIFDFLIGCWFISNNDT